MTPCDDAHDDTLPPDRLDALLQGWRRRQPLATDSSALECRVVAAIRRDEAIVPLSAPAAAMGRWAERATWFAAGLAAAMAFAFSLRPQSPSEEAANWPPSVRFADAQIAEKTVLMAGLEDTFAGGLAWLAEHDQRVDVGLVTEAFPASGVPLAARIVVLSRGYGAAAWEPVWQSDVVARDEEVVDVAAGASGNGRLRLWMHALPDGAIAVDGDLALADTALPFRASFNGVQRPGEPRRVTGHRTGDVEWQVIQTVVPLGPPSHGASTRSASSRGGGLRSRILRGFPAAHALENGPGWLFL